MTFDLGAKSARAASTVLPVAVLLYLAAVPEISHAAAVTLDFSAVPASADLTTGAFVYEMPGGVSVSFTGFQHDDAGAYPDHTSNQTGTVFGVGDGPAVISFSSPVRLLELYVHNFAGDFDSRPGEQKLFRVTGALGGADGFTYDRAAESAPGAGVAEGYIRVAPQADVTVDSLAFFSFDQDALDDLTVVVPEPGAAVAFVGVAAALLLGRRRRDDSPGDGSRPPGT